MIPEWLHLLSIIALAGGLASALAVAADVVRCPQPMWIMAIVWPVTALFGGPMLLWLYFAHGRGGRSHASQSDTPFAIAVAKAACHCGAGCTLGDIMAEWLAFFAPSVAVAFGWTSLFADKMPAVWILDYLFAFALGIAFQYFTIKPMRDLGVGAGLKAAFKADALSLTAWQVGMYGFMAFANYDLFETRLGASLSTDTTAFWFMMQIAMLCGFVTAYPVNWWLIRSGVKERM